MPVEPISLAVGTGLAVAGILLSFKGAVDGYLLLEGFFEKDNGLLDLALRYHLQLKILEVWGSRCNVDDPDPSKCALYEPPEDTQNIIANTLARIASLNNEAETFLDLHKGKNAIVASNTSAKQLQSGRAQVAAVSAKQIRNKVKAKKVIKWTIKNKSKLTVVVDKLEGYNDQLLKFLGPRLTQTFNVTLPSYALAGISDHETIERLQSLEERYFLVSHAAKLKAFQESTKAIKKTATILNSDDTNLSTQTTEGTINQAPRLWILREGPQDLGRVARFGAESFDCRGYRDQGAHQNSRCDVVSCQDSRPSYPTISRNPRGQCSSSPSGSCSPWIHI